MKNISINQPPTYLILLAFFLCCFLFSSCTDESVPDPCDAVICYNGGSCDGNGYCDCPPGYSGTNCQTFDPCYNVNCQNGGTCNNGSCHCPEGFYGENCQYVRTPRAVRITKIDLTQWPEYNPNGSFWDSNSGRPDIFLALDVNGTRIGTTSYYSQCSLSNEYPYSNGVLPIYLANTSLKLTVWLYDYDGNAGSQNMGGIYFYPDDFQSTLPSSRIIGNSNAKIYFRVHFDWVF